MRDVNQRKIRISPYTLYAASWELPGASGMGYIIESCYMSVVNSAATTCNYWGYQVYQQGTARNVVIHAVPSVANAQHLSIDDLDLFTDVGKAIVSYHDNDPAIASGGLSYRMYEYF
jgi:hypothetical protein